jgi:hypothetical protein
VNRGSFTVSTPKRVNVFAGVLLVVCGLVACLWPDSVANYYGMHLMELQAKTSIRAVGGFFVGVGYLFIFFAYTVSNQRPLLFCLAIVLLSFALPRIFGLYLDGFHQMTMVYELLFELLCLMGVVWLYVRVKPIAR